MPIKPTIQLGNTVIRQRAKTVKDISLPKVQKTIKNLIDSMRHDNLVGMAAPQIGKGWRVFVTEIRQTTYRKNIAKGDPLRVFINPKITRSSKKLQSGYEGCGSVAQAGLFGVVKRSQDLICFARTVLAEPY